jgi:hypothetical protein
MSEKKIEYILKRIYDEKVKMSLRTDSNDYFSGYITEIGDDYVKVNFTLNKKCHDSFIKVLRIESVTTEWKEK